MLDLDAGAGVADIREAYRLQMRTWDPDHQDYEPKIKEATERRLAEVQQAYDWLKVNSEAVLTIAKASGAAPRRPSPKQVRKSASPLRRTLGLERVPAGVLFRGFLYLVLVGLLLYGIGAVLVLDPNAWTGPL